MEKGSNSAIFGEELKRLRASVGLSQSALASKIGVTQQFIHKLETGERDRLGADVYLRLCAALGVKCDHFAAMIAPPIADGGEAAETPAEKPKPAKAAKGKRKPAK